MTTADINTFREALAVWAHLNGKDHLEKIARGEEDAEQYVKVIQEFNEKRLPDLEEELKHALSKASPNKYIIRDCERDLSGCKETIEYCKGYKAKEK